MRGRSPSIVPSHPNRTWRVPNGLEMLALILLAALLAVPGLPGNAVLDSGPIASGAGPHVLPAASLVSAANRTLTPAVNVSSCYPIDTSVCVEDAYPSAEPDIVPSPGNYSANISPSANLSLPLLVASRYTLNWSAGTTPNTGPLSPIALNVTGTLWNGDPYYSTVDNSVWHSGIGRPYYTFFGYESQNAAYPFLYEVNFSAGTPAAPNFFPGMSITWWIELTSNNSGVYTRHQGPLFHFRYSGAWAFSPWPGSGQYAGTAASYLDLNVSQAPQVPNWDDPVRLSLWITAADNRSEARIGSLYVDVSETSPSGSLVRTDTLVLPLPVPVGRGVPNGTVVLGASWDQIAGSVIAYRVTAQDLYGNQIQSGMFNYTVGGNGSFVSGIFSDDMQVSTSPTGYDQLQGNPSLLLPGAPLVVTVTSRDPTSSIRQATMTYTLTLSKLGEQVSRTLPLSRIDSTHWSVTLPGLPIDCSVNYSLQVWDFHFVEEFSPTYSYETPSLSYYYPTMPGNSTFLYLFLYDEGNHQWVNGAGVEISSPDHYYNIVTSTVYGEAYPNETYQSYQPLLLPLNVTYHVVVQDSNFLPPGRATPESSISVNVSLTPLTATTRSTLAQGDHYTILQEGTSLYVWLNTTPPPDEFAPNANPTLPLAEIAGPIAAVAVALPLLRWWSRIRKQKVENDRRITL